MRRWFLGLSTRWKTTCLLHIINFDIQIRKSAKRKGNTTVSLQAMEGSVFENILSRLMSNFKINELVKDGDLEVDSIIKF